MERVVPATNFVGTIAVNVDNKDITDEQFRSLVRDSLPIVIYHSGVHELYEDSDKGNGPRIKEVK